MKIMNVILFCFITSACSFYTHDNRTVIEIVKPNGDIERQYHNHNLNIVSWRKVNEGILTIDKEGAINGSAAKLDTDVESVKLLNNAVKLGLSVANPASGAVETAGEIIGHE